MIFTDTEAHFFLTKISKQTKLFKTKTQELNQAIWLSASKN